MVMTEQADGAPTRSPGTPARSPRSRRSTVIRGTVVVLVLIGIIAVFELVFWTTTYASIPRFAFEATGTDDVDTYLVIGSDSRSFVDTPEERETFGDETEVPSARADVVIVLRTPPDAPTEIWSLPRDLFVARPDGTMGRLAVTFEAGPQAVADTLCYGLGIGVDGVIVVRIDGLAALVDALGGVEVDVEVPIRDRETGLDLAQAGVVTLDGRQAVAYARSRTAETELRGAWFLEPDGATRRQERTSDLLDAIARRTDGLNPSTPSGHRIARTAARHVELSENLGLSEIREIVERLSDDTTRDRLDADTTMLGDVPIAHLTIHGRDQATEVGTYPAPCDGS